MCKKCNDTGAIITSYRDGHEDVDLCDCEYNPYTQLRTIKAENTRLREALEKIAKQHSSKYINDGEYDEGLKSAYTIAKQALGE